MPPNEQHVIAAVIIRDGRFLLCRRPPEKRHGSMWEFPGGKLEEGESMLEAAIRELREELRLDVTTVGALRFSSADPNSPFVVNFVDVEAEGDPQLMEHTAFCWVTLDELAVLSLAPTDSKFVEYLMSQV